LRRGARVAAVQALYQLEFGNEPVESVIADFSGHRLGDTEPPLAPSEIDMKLFADIVRGATGDRPRLDGFLNDALDKDRRLDRLEVLMRVILRAGAYELHDRDDIDAALTINEYVAVADAFFNEREPALVNAVLDRVARHRAQNTSAVDESKDTGSDG
jgi:N utilization substance protein B